MTTKRVEKRELSDLTVAEWEKLIDDTLAYHEKIKGRTYPIGLNTKDFWGAIRTPYVTADFIRQFAWCIGDANPLWRDASYARKTRWGGIIAPPECEDYIVFAHGIRESMQIPGENQFDMGAVHEYFIPIHAGDRIVSGIDTYLGVKEKTKPGKPYRLFLELGQRTIFNDMGEKVWTVISGGILTCPRPGAQQQYKQQVAGTIKRVHFSKEQLDTLHAHYDDELEGRLRRGAEIRYWEDVTEGEEIPTIIKGPLDDSDLRSYQTSMLSTAFALKWLRIREDPRKFIDPNTGAYKSAWDWHASDSEAQRRGIAFALAEGRENQAIIGHAITNWMGDDGFVKKLDLQNRAVNYLGDMNWAKGKVARKYVENGEHLVDLDVWAECQDGRIHTKGIATVQLLSRKG